MSTTASQTASIPPTPAVDIASNAAPEPTRKRAKKTKEQQKAVSEHTEKMWTAIRLKQESARKDINTLALEFNRYQSRTSINARVLKLTELLGLRNGWLPNCMLGVRSDKLPVTRISSTPMCSTRRGSRERVSVQLRGCDLDLHVEQREG